MNETQLLTRAIEEQVIESLLPGKVVILIGPRRVGKTVLLGQLLERLQTPYLLLNGENLAHQQALRHRTTAHYESLLEGKRLLIIDEAQKIAEVGQALKLMVDTIPGLRIIATGSSAFDLNRYTGEPLTGRKTTFRLFALAEAEYDQVQTPVERREAMQKRLVFGNYPELLQLASDRLKTRYLRDLVDAYLLRDILEFENIKNADKILALLRLIAYQIGGEVSQQELGQQLGISKNTVDKYLDLLSKVFILHRVSGFSRNLRKEIVKTKRWYFYDNGLRNMLIANLNPVELRNDQGKLWENYLISERLKHQRYTEMAVNNYFWRTYDQQEIDWVEERGGQLYGYEFKWNPKKQPKAPVAWRNNYPEAHFEVMHPDNYAAWIRP